MDVRGLRTLVVLVASAVLAGRAVAAGGQSAPIVVEASGSKLTLTGAHVERFEGNFAIVHLDADYDGKAGQRKGYLTGIGVVRSMPERASAMFYGPKLLDFRIEGLPDFMVKEVREATEKRLAQGVELEQEALMGQSLLPEPLFPKAALGLLRVWPRVEVRKTPAVLLTIDGDPIHGDRAEHGPAVRREHGLGPVFPPEALQPFPSRRPVLVRGVFREGSMDSAALGAAERPFEHPRVASADARQGVHGQARKALAAAGHRGRDRANGAGGVRRRAEAGAGSEHAVFLCREHGFGRVLRQVRGRPAFGVGPLVHGAIVERALGGAGRRRSSGLAKMPRDHPKARVLVELPGTEEGKAAVQAANTAVTATVRRDLNLEVQLLGPPDLVPVQGNLSYVKNTPEDMIAVGDRFYCCRNGVWFAANEAVGPWAVCHLVPGAVQTLQPSSPLYHLRFCQVLAYSPTTVTFGYTSGYTGAFVDDGAIVYGTGYAEPGYVANGVYYGLPPILGLGRRFDATTGRFVEQTPPVGPFSGTAKDIGKSTPNRVAELWPRWGRVGYGYGARALALSAVRPMEWGAGCISHGFTPVPLADASQTAPVPLPPPQNEAPPPAVAFDRPPTLFVGTDGKVYKLDRHKWWERSKSAQDQWTEIGLPPRDVELQGSLVGQMQPRPRPKAN